MDELLQQLNQRGHSILLIGGQAMRLMGMPRYSMDWDLFVPPRTEQNFARLNELLEHDLDEPLLPLGPRGEHFVQTYQTRWGVLQFHLGVPGLPRFDEAEAAGISRQTETGALGNGFRVRICWLPNRPLADRKTRATSNSSSNWSARESCEARAEAKGEVLPLGSKFSRREQRVISDPLLDQPEQGHFPFQARTRWPDESDGPSEQNRLLRIRLEF